MPIMSELLYKLECGFKTTTSESQRHLLPPTAVDSALPIWPWPIPHLNTSLSWMGKDFKYLCGFSIKNWQCADKFLWPKLMMGIIIIMISLVTFCCHHVLEHMQTACSICRPTALGLELPAWWCPHTLWEQKPPESIWIHYILYHMGK